MVSRNIHARSFLFQTNKNRGQGTGSNLLLRHIRIQILMLLRIVDIHHIILFKIFRLNAHQLQHRVLLIR